MLRIKKKILGYIFGILSSASILCTILFTESYNSESDAIVLISGILLFAASIYLLTLIVGITITLITSNDSIVILPTPEQKLRILSGKNLLTEHPVEIELNNLTIDKLMDRYNPEGEYVDALNAGD